MHPKKESKSTVDDDDEEDVVRKKETTEDPGKKSKTKSVTKEPKNKSKDFQKTMFQSEHLSEDGKEKNMDSKSVSFSPAVHKRESVGGA